MKRLKITAFLLLASLTFGSLHGYAETDLAPAEEYEFSQAELEQILAPIALYPDTILSHILIASTYPLEVIQAKRWASKNQSVKGDSALKAVSSKDWAPSVKALVPFPNILEKMSEDLEWVQKLGDAFLQDEELVLASIQDLRQRAYQEGNLDDLEHLKISHEENHIIIEPVDEGVVYVPYYDTRVVYGNWGWSSYPPIHWAYFDNYHNQFYWSPRVRLGSGFYFSSFHWGRRNVVVVDHHRHNHYRFHSGRHVSRHADSRRWTHNPRHRRGVAYRTPRIRHHGNNAAGRKRAIVSRTSGHRSNQSQRSVRRAHLENRERRAASNLQNRMRDRGDRQGQSRRSFNGKQQVENGRKSVVTRQQRQQQTSNKRSHTRTERNRESVKRAKRETSASTEKREGVQQARRHRQNFVKSNSQTTDKRNVSKPRTAAGNRLPNRVKRAQPKRSAKNSERSAHKTRSATTRSATKRSASSTRRSASRNASRER